MYDMKQVIIRASQSDFGQVDFYSYLPKGQVKEDGGCSTPAFTGFVLIVSKLSSLSENY